MSEYPFQFATLRYIHDPTTQEFLNVGVVVYSREARYIRAKTSQRYGRLSRTFLNINGDHYRRLARTLDNRMQRLHARLRQDSFLEGLPLRIEDVLAQVLPPSYSALMFGAFGTGLTDNLDGELEWLYDRLVERYVSPEETESREDEDVWEVYREKMDQVDITPRLSSGVTITAPRYNYSYEFKHAWRNQRWHPLQPVSFDLVHGRSISEKANTWVGRSIALADSEEIGTLFLLVGAPRRGELLDVYQEAVQYLRDQIAVEHEVIEEEQATAFSERLAQLVGEHE